MHVKCEKRMQHIHLFVCILYSIVCECGVWKGWARNVIKIHTHTNTSIVYQTNRSKRLKNQDSQQFVFLKNCRFSSRKRWQAAFSLDLSSDRIPLCSHWHFSLKSTWEKVPTACACASFFFRFGYTQNIYAKLKWTRRFNFLFTFPTIEIAIRESKGQRFGKVGLLKCQRTKDRYVPNMLQAQIWFLQTMMHSLLICCVVFFVLHWKKSIVHSKNPFAICNRITFRFLMQPIKFKTKKDSIFFPCVRFILNPLQSAVKCNEANMSIHCAKRIWN